jgi:hypothetical protein
MGLNIGFDGIYVISLDLNVNINSGNKIKISWNLPSGHFPTVSYVSHCPVRSMIYLLKIVIV